MGREISHVLPPKFPVTSQQAGSIGHTDPPLTPDSRYALTITILYRLYGSNTVPPGPSSKVHPDRFAASPALCTGLCLCTYPFIGKLYTLILKKDSKHVKPAKHRQLSMNLVITLKSLWWNWIKASWMKRLALSYSYGSQPRAF